MTVRIEKDGPITTVIHSTPEARNAMDPASVGAISEEGISGAGRFKSGKGRHGEFDDIS